jgi:hypothetical protein
MRTIVKSAGDESRPAHAPDAVDATSFSNVDTGGS